MSVVVAGAVDDFANDLVSDALKEKIAAELDVPSSSVTLDFTAASIVVTVTVTFGSADAATVAEDTLATHLTSTDAASAFLSTPQLVVTVEQIRSTPTVEVADSQPPPPDAPPPQLPHPLPPDDPPPQLPHPLPPDAPPPQLPCASTNLTNWTLDGAVQGLDATDVVVVSVGSANGQDSALDTVEVSGAGSGWFSFDGLALEPHWVKFEGTGFAADLAQIIDPPSQTGDCGEAAARRRRRLTSDGEECGAAACLSATKTGVFQGTRSSSHTFQYTWREDASRAGAAETAHVVSPPNLTFLGEDLVRRRGDDQGSDKLHHLHNILLADDQVVWSSEYAYRLLETLNAIPQLQTRNFYDVQTLPPSKWVLTNDYIADDITIDTNGTARLVRISKATFVHAAPLVVRLNGERGSFFSRRLHHAAVRFVTDEGADTAAVQHIMATRYGCTTAVANELYATLTAPTTVEDQHAFQPFDTHPAEPLLLLTMLEELPSGLHAVPGLRYLLRRADGQIHPLYPTAAAVAWPDAHNESYVEFMEHGMVGDLRSTRRLILHEKAHFLWSNLFSDELKANWTALAGWYPCEEAASGWCTSNQVEFVSWYAHGINPNEDMAESIAYYVESPSALLACCPEKHAFIRDRIMHGYRYISLVRPDLTFQVLNLMPDYTYPGKIIRVSITVVGAPTDDKVCTVEVELHTLGGVFEGADYAYFRLHSEIGTYHDQYLYPVDGSNNGILSGTFTMSKHAKAGLWQPQQISISDTAGNQRFAGVHDFGWRLHLDNPLEDVAEPQYVDGSLTLSVFESSLEGHAVQYIRVTFLLIEDQEMDDWGGVYTRLVNDVLGSGTNGLQQYGHPGLTSVPASECESGSSSSVPAGWLCQRATMDHLITHYRVSGNYAVSQLMMKDVAANVKTVSFTASESTPTPVWVAAQTLTPDVTPPELDLNNISVSAYPTNPSAPNGETVVTIVYNARDDLSGLGRVNYRLLDPQGTSYFEYHYHANFYSSFFSGDPTAWAAYTINVVLPVGSPPGTWGLESLELNDKVDNEASHNFVENGHFELQSGRRRMTSVGEHALASLSFEVVGLGMS